MKPPVDAPMSSADAAVDVDRERVERVRELEPAAADVGMIRDGDGRPPRRRATAVPALSTGWPSTRTCPARISARARSRDAARPRSTSSTSRRSRRSSIACGATTQSRDRRQLPGEAGRASSAAMRARSTHSAASAPRFVEAVERRVGGLAGRGVLAGGLAELATRLRRRGCRRRSGRRGRPGRRNADGRDLSAVAPAMIAPASAATRISAPVLRACISRSAGAVERLRARARPPADRAPGRRPCRPHPRPRRRSRPSAACGGSTRRPRRPRARFAREQGEGFGQQRVAGEDGHAFAVDDVGGRPPPPQVSSSIAGRSSCTSE